MVKFVSQLRPQCPDIILNVYVKVFFNAINIEIGGYGGKQIITVMRVGLFQPIKSFN